MESIDTIDGAKGPTPFPAPSPGRTHRDRPVLAGVASLLGVLVLTSAGGHSHAVGNAAEVQRVLALSDDLAYGEYLAGECAGCHSIDARASDAAGAVPVIHGLPAAQVVAALLEYRDGTRDSTTMGGIAGPLIDEEIAVLGHHLASLAAPDAVAGSPVPDVESEVDALGTGQELGAPVEVGIRPDLAYVSVPTPDGDVVIERIQDTDHRLEGDFGRTSRPCPPFCIQPIAPVEGVMTIGELELLDALQDPDTLVIDSRELDWHLEGTIPGAVNIPYTEVASRLDELGCRRSDAAGDGDERSSGWDCSAARTVALFCNGAWCGQSPTAIRAMAREGYPLERIRYYRAGMQGWRMLGLTVIKGSF